MLFEFLTCPQSCPQKFFASIKLFHCRLLIDRGVRGLRTSGFEKDRLKRAPFFSTVFELFTYWMSVSATRRGVSRLLIQCLIRGR
jgi:hypothetical protein